MSLREEQCNKVCRILDDVLANRPTERDSLIVAVRKAFEAEPHWIPVTERSPRKRDHKDDMVLDCNENGSIRFNTCINGTWVYGNPIAWMPLPEPFKGEEVTKTG